MEILSGLIEMIEVLLLVVIVLNLSNINKKLENDK